ncbi:MAG: O-antigen ligase family protein [Candidatus Goldbacteria bacterium]|nr:O-antigen ligase family protein [Candidatus Goldiibacteriota bacterium]
MKKFKNIALLNIALYIIILFLCESRGVFISFILSSILFLIIFLKINKNISFDKKTLYYIALFIFFIVIFTPGFFLALQSFSNKFKSIILMNDENIFSRLLLIKSSFKIFLNNPILGGGPGSIKKFIQLKEAEFLNNDNNIYTFVNSSYSHNDYVQILTETGIIGIFLYILILLFAFKKIENKIITCCFEEKVFLVCITFSLFFIIFESFFNFPLFIFPTSFFFYFLIGVSYSQYNYFITISNFSFKSKLLILFILFPLLVLFVKDINKIVSNIYLSSAIKESAYNTTNAEKLFKKTIFLDKKNFHNITNFASFYFNIEKYENSLLLFTMAIKDFPYSADLYYNIGMIYEIFKDYKNAINFYKMSLYLYPNFFDANLRLYNILFKIYPNDENKYLLYLQRILKYDSKFKPSSNFNIYYFKEETIATYSK